MQEMDDDTGKRLRRKIPEDVRAGSDTAEAAPPSIRIHVRNWQGTELWLDAQFANPHRALSHRLKPDRIWQVSSEQAAYGRGELLVPSARARPI